MAYVDGPAALTDAVRLSRNDYLQTARTVPSLHSFLAHYIDNIDRRDPNDTITVILPEYIAGRWWEHLLHNQTALRLKASLLFRPGTVVTSVPYHPHQHKEAATAKN